MTDTYREGLLDIAGRYVAEFQKQPEVTLQMFCNTSAPLEIMNSVYGFMVNDKEILKIEELPIDTKRKLWEQVKLTCTTANKEKSIKLCRCIWLINFILEK